MALMVQSDQSATLQPIPVNTSEDRTLAVPQGATVQTGYVPVDRVRHGCRDRMSLEAVEKAYRRRLQLGSSQPWPPPVGRWDGETFIIHDGRHEHLAAWMLGCRAILVAWMESG